MGTYERETRVAASLDDVWAFHSRASGLAAVTPDWLCLRVESVTGPDGGRDADVLAPGTRIRLSARPLGVGPRREWSSVVRERRREDGAALLRDEVVDGPFPRWVHTHAFFTDGGATLVRDRVAYDLPLGAAGTALEPLAFLGFEPLFRHRHRRTRDLLEAADAAPP